jgi:hypothetical protein
MDYPKVRSLSSETYTLKYCYRYEPGFSVYSLNDIILFKSDGDTTPEICRYIENEEQIIEEEDQHQIFFIVKHITMAENVSSIHFLKIALFPKEKKQDSVVNLVFFPLIKPWDDYLMTEQDELIKEALWEQEKFVSLKYDIVEFEDIEVYVENVDTEVDSD